MAKSLEAHDKLIQEIFSGNYQFDIPHYQRPYAWTTEQTGELFDDLLAAMSDSSDTNADSQYFLGSIVLIKEDRNSKSFVVDGQQRLTTITMLFAVLREAMPDVAGGITELIYKEDKLFHSEKKYRLTARAEDANFFREYVQEPGGIAQLVANTEKLQDSRLRYRENIILLRKKIGELSSADLKRLLKFLVMNCSLVVISTPNLEAAYRIFSVLNNRGLELAPIDIIKAEILEMTRKQSGEGESQAYAKKWSEIESELGRNAFGELLGHIRSIYAKKKQKSTLIKEFQEYVTEYRENHPIDLIERVITPYAEVWSFVRNADFAAVEHAEIINEYLSWLNRVGFKDWVPPALVYFKRFRQQPKQLATFFRLLERLTFFLLVTKAGINERIETYSALTKEIEQEAFNGDAAALTVLTLNDRQKSNFIAALDGNIYRDLPSARMLLILRLETLCSDGSKRQEFKHLSLEHVLPQNPSKDSEWLQWFPNEEERDSWTHRLANLVPLHTRKNSAASNFPFAKKKDEYFRGKDTASPFVLTQEVRAETEWTPALLAERQERLVGKLKQYWALTVMLDENATDMTTH